MSKKKKAPHYVNVRNSHGLYSGWRDNRELPFYFTATAYWLFNLKDATKLRDISFYEQIRKSIPDYIINRAGGYNESN